MDQQVALRTAAKRPAEELASVGTFNTETIERLLHTSYDQFAGKATMLNFLPCWPNGSQVSG